MKRLNMNLLGLTFLLLAYSVCMVQVFRVSMASGEGALGALGGNQRVVRIMHWQLEPGYRNALQQIIDEFNARPEVREANVRVVQMSIATRYYKQFVNTHLISGTAPDLVERGMARMTTGNYAAKYFEPMSTWVEEPNPFNAPEYLPEGLSPQLAEALSTRPWRETFIDGMAGGWDETLQEYYGVPTSFFGGIRLFYNKQMMAEVKRMLRDDLADGEAPPWLQSFMAKGYLPLDASLQAWLADDTPPNTLGRLMLICEGVNEYARRTEQDLLAPIAGDANSKALFANQYRTPFTAAYAEQLDTDRNSSVEALETFAGWQRKVWSFDDARVEGFYDCVQALSQYFPAGFTGLDREQMNRRFALGNACMMASGSWDLMGIIQGAQDKTEADERFDVGLFEFPMPGPGEKWSDLVRYPANETWVKAGATYQINQRSANKEWALYFLKYISSYSVNERYNRRAGLVPCVIGTEPTDELKPFAPRVRGLWGSTAFNYELQGSFISNRYDGVLIQFVTGEIDYGQLVQAMREFMTNERNGINRGWYEAWIRQRDDVWNKQAILSGHATGPLLQGRTQGEDGRDPWANYRTILMYSVSLNNAQNTHQQWHDQFPDQPFPDFR